MFFRSCFLYRAWRHQAAACRHLALAKIAAAQEDFSNKNFVGNYVLIQPSSDAII